MTLDRDVIREAWDGLARHRVRSVLSGLGILFGVAAVIGILSIGEGARQEQQTLIESMGILNFRIRNKDLGDDPEREKEIRRKSSGLSARDVEALVAELPDATHVGSARELPLQEIVPRPKDPSAVDVIGADAAWLVSSNLVLREGRPLTSADEAALAQVCVMGPVARRQIFGAKPALGERVRVDQTWLTVVGFFDDGSTSGAEVEGVDVVNRNGAIIAPLSTVQRRIARNDGSPPLSEIQVAVGTVDQVPGHTAVASRILKRMHREQPDYELVVPLKLLEQSRAQQRIFNLVMGLIAGISLLVGGIGIMNIMLATVLERTREIGIRLAVGAKPSDIRVLFLAEALLISLLGGILGVAAGVLISWTVALATGWATAVSIQAVLLATTISALEGVVFGFVPARRASQLPPAIAVRHSG